MDPVLGRVYPSSRVILREPKRLEESRVVHERSSHSTGFFDSFHSLRMTANLGVHGLALLVCAASLRAAPPVVTSVDMRGLQIGKPTTLVITGTDLLPNPRLLTTARIAKQGKHVQGGDPFFHSS